MDMAAEYIILHNSAGFIFINQPAFFLFWIPFFGFIFFRLVFVDRARVIIPYYTAYSNKKFIYKCVQFYSMQRMHMDVTRDRKIRSTVFCVPVNSWRRSTLLFRSYRDFYIQCLWRHSILCWLLLLYTIVTLVFPYASKLNAHAKMPVQNTFVYGIPLAVDPPFAFRTI